MCRPEFQPEEIDAADVIDVVPPAKQPTVEGLANSFLQGCEALCTSLVPDCLFFFF